MRGALLATALVLLGCATEAHRLEVAGSPPAPAPATEPFPAKPSLVQVLSRIEGTPALIAAREAVSAARGDVRQAGLAPNPVLQVRGEKIDPEELDRGIQKRGFSVRERIETGGKREARVRVGEGRVGEALTATRASLLEAARAAAGAHQDAVLASWLLRLRREEARVAEELLALQSAKVRAGRLTESALPPLRIRLGELRTAALEEEARHRSALRRLEGSLALPPGTVREVLPPLVDDPALPEPATPALFQANPAIAVRRAALETTGARIREAEAGTVPDVTVGIGFEDAREPVEGRRQTLGLTVEAPLPVIDRNQGAILAAKAVARRAEALLRDEEARVRSEYAEAWEVASSLRRSRAAWEEQVVTARETDLGIARAALAAGRSDRAPVLEKELALLAARTRSAELAGGISRRVLDAWALLGRPVEEWRGSALPPHLVPPPRREKETEP
jgi:cobalt-zinc-cadmium efflux system outer membrane protein